MIDLRRGLLILFVLALCFAGSFSGTGGAVAQGSRAGDTRKSEFLGGREVAAGQVIVKFRTSAKQHGVASAKEDVDADVDRIVGRSGARLLHSRSMDTATLIKQLAARSDVLYVEPNYVIRPAAVPNDPRFPEMWGLKNTGQSSGGTAAGTVGADISAPAAWDISVGSRDNVVAVVDTGVDYNHPDLAANMWSAPAPFTVEIEGQTIRCEAGTHGFNAITKTCDPLDDHNHGTHIAGTIGAIGNNGLGVVGVNQTASIMGLKFIDASGAGTLTDAINAIEFAIQAKQAFGAGANVRVLSNSWGWNGEPSQALLDEINRADVNNMLFVAGAGNAGADNDVTPFYPASYSAPNVIAVAATDNGDSLAVSPDWGSNFGRNTVHLGAPGVLVLSTVVGGSYDWFSGTSMATPHVSGAAALVLSRCSLDTPALKETLLNNIDQVPSLSMTTMTGGRLNVNKAIRACALPPPANKAPTVSLTSPANGASYTAAAEVTISADAADSDGTVSKVDFYAGTQLIGTAMAAPYRITWSKAAAGGYTITARATDNLKAETTSSGVAITVNPSARVNVALSANGATATASSQHNDSFPASAAINGDRYHLYQADGRYNMWHSRVGASKPDWLQVDFNGPKTVDEIDVITLQDNHVDAVDPAESMTFTKYGLTDFEVQYWGGSGWVTVPGGNVVGNNQVWRKFTFPGVTTNRIRVLIRASKDGYSRVPELEAWGGDGTGVPAPSSPGRTNVALSSNGASAAGSSQHTADFPAAAAIDGDRYHLYLPDGRYNMWHSKVGAAKPDWLQVDFSGSKTIDEVNVVTLQDNHTSPIVPTESTTFQSYGLTSFEVQYWGGSGWVTVPGGNVTGNNKVWRKFTFPAVTTNKIRVLIYATADGYSRVMELEAFGT